MAASSWVGESSSFRSTTYFASSYATPLTPAQLDSLEMNLHGVAGGILRRRFLPLLQRRRVFIARKLITVARQPLSFGSNGRRAVHDESMNTVKQLLLSNGASGISGVVATNGSPNDDVCRVLARLPWDVVAAALEPHLKPVSYRTGEILLFPDTPAEGNATFFVLQGSVCVVAKEEARTQAVQMYLKRAPASAAFEAAKVGTTHPSLRILKAPCVVGLDDAICFAPHASTCLFAAPQEHSMASVVDVIQLSNRSFQSALLELVSNDAAIVPTKPGLTSNFPMSFRRQSTTSFASGSAPPNSAARRVSKFNQLVGAPSSVTASPTTSAKSGDGFEARDDAAKKKHLQLQQTKKELEGSVAKARELCLVKEFPLTEELLRLSWLFQSLPAHVLPELLKNLKPLWLPPGSKIAVAGEVNRKWYFLRRGRCVILPNRAKQDVDGTTKAQRKSTLMNSGSVTTASTAVEAGSSIGELSLIFEEPRSHTIQTATACDLWVMEQRSFAEILGGDENLRVACQRKAAVLRAKWLAAQRYSLALHDYLENCALFQPCWSELLYSMVVDALEPLVLPQRTLVASASEFCDRLLIIVKGTLSSQRGDVPLQFGPGSVLGESCFVRHRWPFAIAATTIVDCWHLSAAKFRSIAEKLDLLQTLSTWVPESDRAKYLTRLNEVHAGRFVPTTTYGLLRTAFAEGARELVPALPQTSAVHRRRGERRTSFVAHFRKVSLERLESLCIEFPHSFSMGDLLFRTSYGSRADHLQETYRASRGLGAHDRASSSSSSSPGSHSAEDDHKRTPRRRSPLSGQHSDDSRKASDLKRRKEKALARLHREQAVELARRRVIQRMVGEEVASPSDSLSSDSGDAGALGHSDDVLSPDEQLKQYRANRRSHKVHGGPNSAVLSRVDDGTVMNDAQLAADQGVIRRVLREQRRKERSTVTSGSNALVVSAAIANGGGGPAGGGHRNSSLALDASDSQAYHPHRGSESVSFSTSPSARIASGSIYSEDERSAAGSNADSDRGRKESAAVTSTKAALVPKGAQEWETQLRTYFSGGEVATPTLRDMARLLRTRNRKVRARHKSRTPTKAADSSLVRTHMRAALDAILAPIADDLLHVCVHANDPEVTSGLPHQQLHRRLISLSSQHRLSRLLNSGAASSSPSKAPLHGGGEGEVIPGLAAATDLVMTDGASSTGANEKVKMLYQLFRAGVGSKASKTTAPSAATAATPAATEAPDQGAASFLDFRVSRRVRGAAATFVPGVEAHTATTEGEPKDSATKTSMVSPTQASNPGTSANNNYNPDGASAVDGARDSAQTPSSSYARRRSSMVRRKSLDGLTTLNAQPSTKLPASLSLAQFPNRQLYYQHVGRQLTEMVGVNPLPLFDAVCSKYRCSWVDEEESNDHPASVYTEFHEYLSAAQKTKHSGPNTTATTTANESLNSPAASFRSVRSPARAPLPTSSAESPLMSAAVHSSKSNTTSSSSMIHTQRDFDAAAAEELALGRVGTPATPDSCNSPALSDLGWSEWDGSGDAEGPGGLMLSSSQLTRQRSLSRRASTVSSFRKDSGISESGNSSQASLASVETPLPVAGGVAAPPFESSITGNTFGDALPEQLEVVTDAIRRGELRPEIDRLLALAEAESVLVLWIDGIGAIDVLAQPEEGESVELASARRILQSVLRHHHRNRTQPRHERAFGEVEDDTHFAFDSEALRDKSASDNAGARRFPDAKETNAMIRKMERLADNEALKPDKSEALFAVDSALLRAVEDLQAFFQQRNSSAVEQQEQHGRRRMGGDVVEGRTDDRDKGCGHCTLPVLLEQDAGFDFLAEALAEQVPVEMPRDAAQDEEGEDEEGVSESRERTVLVGSRQFGMNPRPLRRAHPPLRQPTDWLDFVPQDDVPVPKFASFTAFQDALGGSQTSQLDTSQAAAAASTSRRGRPVFDEAAPSSHTLPTAAVRDSGCSPHPGAEAVGGVSGDDGPSDGHASTLSQASQQSSNGTRAGRRTLSLRRKPLKRFARSTIINASANDFGGAAGIQHEGARRSTAMIRQLHQRLVQSVAHDAARRHSRAAQQRAVEASSRNLPLVPLTKNIAIVLLPMPSRESTHCQRRVWKNLSIPIVPRNPSTQVV